MSEGAQSLQPAVHHLTKGITVHLVQKALSVLALGSLVACAAPPSKPLEAPPWEAAVTHFGHSELNEAASAYVSLYKQTIERSLSERRYKEDLAYKHLSAEACFDSRASRLMDKKLSQQEKERLVLASVSSDKFLAFQDLSKGYFTRINGLEMLTCDMAGLKVSHRDARF